MNQVWGISNSDVYYSMFQERKKIVKGMKDHVRKLALDQFGSLVSIVCYLSKDAIFHIIF